MSRAAAAVVLLLLVIGVAAHAGDMLGWIAADERVSGSICCDLSGPVVELVVSERTGYRRPFSLLQLNEQGGMSWLAFAVSELRGVFSPDTLLHTQLLSVVVLQLAALWAVWPLAGPWAALAAALSMPFLPGIAFSARNWAPFPMQSALLIVALGGAVRGLDRARWAAVVVLAGVLGATASRLITDDLLFIQSIGLMLAASVIGGLIRREVADGRAVSRPRLATAALITAALMLGAIIGAFAPRGDVAHHIGYYAEELGVQAGDAAPTYAQLADPWSEAALLAYPRRLSNFELGLRWSYLLLLALPGFVWLGRGRAAIAAGGLGPLVILSLVAKKQIFYVYLILPFIPLAVAIGLLAPLRRWPWAQAAGAAALVGIAATGLDTEPPEQGSNVGIVRQWQREVFQFPYPLTLYPQQRDAAGRMSPDYLIAVLPKTCPAPLGVMVLDNEIEGALLGEPELAARLSVELAAAGLCAKIYRRLPDDGGSLDLLWVGGDDTGSCQVSHEQSWAAAWAQAYRATDWDVVDQRNSGADGRCRTLLVRSGSRWAETVQANLDALSE